MRTKGVGYQRRGEVSHRRYNRKTSLRRFKRTGSFKDVGNGSGHRAGEKWANEKDIDPNSTVRKYSKNSPSFDEGVYLSKQKKKMAQKMK